MTSSPIPALDVIGLEAALKAFLQFARSDPDYPHEQMGAIRVVITAYLRHTDRANHTARADVAEGYVLVPKEPTEAMHQGAQSTTSALITRGHSRAIWAAMLAASPSQGDSA